MKAYEFQCNMLFSYFKFSLFRFTVTCCQNYFFSPNVSSPQTFEIVIWNILLMYAWCAKVSRFVRYCCVSILSPLPSLLSYRSLSLSSPFLSLSIDAPLSRLLSFSWIIFCTLFQSIRLRSLMQPKLAIKNERFEKRIYRHFGLVINK